MNLKNTLVAAQRRANQLTRANQTPTPTYVIHMLPWVNLDRIDRADCSWVIREARPHHYIDTYTVVPSSHIILKRKDVE